jgi:hypothetical protein
VDVHVQGPWGIGMEKEALDPRLLPGLPEGDALPQGLTPLGVTPWLQPPLQLAMVHEQDPFPRGAEDQGASREMPFLDPAIKGVAVPRHEGSYPRKIPRFIGIRGLEAAQAFGETHELILG